MRKHFLTPRYLRDYLKIFTRAAGTAAVRSAIRRLGRGGRGMSDTGASAGPGLQPRAGHLRRRGRLQARHRRPGDGADRPGVAPRRRLDRLGADRGRRERARRPTGRPFEVDTAGEGDVPGPAGRQRRRRLRPLLQHLRQPDAVVHPALPLGPVQRPGHPPPRGRGVRVRLQRRQRGPRQGGRRGDRGRRRAGRDGPRLPPLHAARARPQARGPTRSCTTSSTSRGRSPTPGACCRAASATRSTRGCWPTTSSASTRGPTAGTSCSAAAT